MQTAGLHLIHALLALPEYLMEPKPKKLLDQVREAMRLKHYAYRAEERCIQWLRRYILFHNERHPKEMGKAEIEAFLAHLLWMARNVRSSGCLKGQPSPSSRNAIAPTCYLIKDRFVKIRITSPGLIVGKGLDHSCGAA